MALVETSHDELSQALVIGTDPKRTGRMRWWQGLDGERVLQAEWRDEFSTIWIAIPTVTEITG